jgi:HEAT repeat protein
MDWNAPPPSDKELPAILGQLVIKARSQGSDEKREAVEAIYELAFKVGPKAAKAVPVLIERLGDADSKTAESALWALGYCKPQSIEPLIDCLLNVDPQVRERAAWSIGNIGDEAQSASDTLRRLLEDPVASVRSRAAWALGLVHDCDTRTVGSLFQMVEAGTTVDRSSALHALGNIGQSMTDRSGLHRHRPLILSALNDADENTRWAALYVLEALDLPVLEHADVLLGMLKQDPPERVVHAVLSQLIKIAPQINLSTHAAYLCRWLNRDSRSASQVCKILSLIHPAPLDVLDMLVAALNVDEYVVPVATALWKIDRRVSESLPALARIFDEYDQAVCDVICELGPAAAPLLPKLIEVMQSEDSWDLQWAASDALGAIASADPSVVEALQAALGHPSPIVRSAAARALARVGTPAIPRLLTLLQAHDDPRAAWAAFSLGEMGSIAISAAPELLEGLQSVKNVLSTACAIALARTTGDPQTVPYLVRIIESGEAASPRCAAANALGGLGPVAITAVPALELLLDDADPDCSTAAQEALDAIKAKAH